MLFIVLRLSNEKYIYIELIITLYGKSMNMDQADETNYMSKNTYYDKINVGENTWKYGRVMYVSLNQIYEKHTPHLKMEVQ